jgi:hypothetical protein
MNTTTESIHELLNKELELNCHKPKISRTLNCQVLDSSMFVQPRYNEHLECLIKRAHATQPFSIRAPVKAHNRLCGDDTRV